MEIIIHRVNTIEKLKTVPEEYGLEIDLRAKGDRIILNHEPHEDGDDFEEWLKFYKHQTIILNIKEAGIENECVELCKKAGVKSWFLLDVEFPYIYYATRRDKNRDIAIRFSEAEPIEMALAQKGLCDWVWVDVNTEFPLNKTNYKQLKDAGFKLCLVCPERWGRPEDIANYRKIMKENNIELDAVMTALEHVDKWK